MTFVHNKEGIEIRKSENLTKHIQINKQENKGRKLKRKKLEDAKGDSEITILSLFK